MILIFSYTICRFWTQKPKSSRTSYFDYIWNNWVKVKSVTKSIYLHLITTNDIWKNLLFLRLDCRPRAERFDIVSNDHGRIQNCNFSVSDQKCRFWASLIQRSKLSKLGPKIKIVSLSWNLVSRLIRIWRIQWWCSLFSLFVENAVLGQIWSQNSKLSV